MRLFRMAALAIAIVGGYLGLASAPASAAPGPEGQVHATHPLVADAEYTQFYGRRGYYGRPYYGRRVVYARPVYRRPVYYARPVYYRRPVVVRRVYRGPRVVCRVRARLVATPYGYVRRPVRVCTRRF